MKFPLLLAIIFGSVLTSCRPIPEPTTVTMVEGVVMNKYTHQPLPGVLVTAKSWHYTLFSGVYADSITSVLTDASGHYQLTFDATAKGTIYRVDIKASRLIFDLTDYGKYEYRSGSDGASLMTGQANQVDFTATPYVPVRVFLNVEKKGASLLDAVFRADEGDHQGYYTGTIVTDTARAMQRIILNTTIRVIPNRTYNFTIYKALVTCKSPYNCQNTNFNVTTLNRYISYTDTTKVYLH